MFLVGFSGIWVEGPELHKEQPCTPVGSGKTEAGTQSGKPWLENNNLALFAGLVSLKEDNISFAF